MRVRDGLLAVLALGLAALSAWNWRQIDQAVRRELHVVDGVPIELFLPLDARPLTPALVISHGFSGNRQLMYGFGYVLARNGYVAALVDFAGHGLSRDRLPDGFNDAQYRKLAANLDTALRFVRARPEVDAVRVGLLGHSMGATAVARYAAERDDVPLTVAISLGAFGSSLPPDPARPRNLLVLVGALEFEGFLRGSTNALRVAWPQGIANQTYGDFAAGTARRLVIVPGVEHITVLFSDSAHQEVVRWLDQAFGVIRAGTLHADGRMVWVLGWYAAVLLGFFPLSRALLGRPDQPPTYPVGLSALHALLVMTLAVGGAALALWLGLIPYRWIPLTVGNYVGAFFAVAGGIVLGHQLACNRRVAAIVAGLSLASFARSALPALLLAAYAVFTFGIAAHLAWSNFALVGARLWVFGVLWVSCFLFFLGDELLTRGALARRLVLWAATKLVVLIGLALAVLWLGAPPFLLLLIPVMVVLFVWHGAYAHRLYQLTAGALHGALLNTSVFAWVIAATFALVAA
ncbi:MAG: alpha/beta hydrolase [Thermoflexales bacterium]